MRLTLITNFSSSDMFKRVVKGFFQIRWTNREISVYPMSTLLYRQHAQHTVNIDTMHIDDLLSGNERIRNYIYGLNA